MTFTLRGNSIPTDGSGRVNVTDINPNGDNSEDALICRSEGVISTIGDWFLHPTEMSTDVNDRVCVNKKLTISVSRVWSGGNRT